MNLNRNVYLIEGLWSRLAHSTRWLRLGYPPGAAKQMREILVYEITNILSEGFTNG